MIFQRVVHSAYFELPGKNVFLYCPAHATDTLNISSLFGEGGLPFVLVFYGESFSEVSRIYLDQLIESGSRYIFWSRSCREIDIQSGASIRLNGNKVAGMENFGFFPDDFPVYVSADIVPGRIVYEEQRKALVMRTEGGKAYQFVAHAGGLDSTGGAFEEACIPLQHNSEPFAQKQTTLEDNFGSFCILTKPSKKKLLQPAVPYLLKQGTAIPEVVFGDLFPEKEFDKKVDSVVTLFPQRDVRNDVKNAAGFAEFFIRHGAVLSTHIPDDKGRRLTANDLRPLICVLSKVETGSNGSLRRNYFFVPRHDAKLSLAKSGDAKMLLGRSGTEAIGVEGNTCNLHFQSSSELLLDLTTSEVNGKAYTLQKSGESRTVRVIINKLTKNERSDIIYYTDSQRAPQFKQAPASKEKQVYKEYTYIPHGLIKGLSLPFIPALSVRGNPNLAMVEQALPSIRLGMVPPNRQKSFLADSEYITPQGIVIRGNEYHLARQQEEKGLRFGFSITSEDPNLRMSLTKDEVFFVLTPELVRQALLNLEGAMKIEAVLKMERFQVTLTDLFKNLAPDGPKSSHSKCIILCKFHNKSISDLVRDPKQWSNSGPLRLSQKELAEVRSAIDTAIKPCEDNDYFKVLYNSEGWNGVVVLNIPVKGDDTDPVLEGLMSAQGKDPNSEPKPEEEQEAPKVVLKTEMVYQYVAFPANKTVVKDGQVVVEKSALYGLIDYNPFRDAEDYDKVYNYLNGKNSEADEKYRFLLTRLYVDFRNSSIHKFDSNVFVRAAELFDDSGVTFQENLVNNNDPDRYKKPAIPKLFRLRGTYQKNAASEPEFRFFLETELEIKVDKSVIKKIYLHGASFTFVGGDKAKGRTFRFDLDVRMTFEGIAAEYFSFKALRLRNIGLKFLLEGSKGLKAPKFDLSRLLVLPDISFDRKGLLGNFPVRLSGFKSYAIDAGELVDFDFMPLFPGNFDGIDATSLFSFVFDVDLGTLGGLDGLKALNGQLLLGWFRGANGKEGGLHIGFRLASVETHLEIDLFGALKLTVEKLGLGTFSMPDGKCNGYYIRLNDVKLEMFGIKLPPKNNRFYGILMVAPDQKDENRKVAWLVNYTRKPVDDDPENIGKLVMGIGQRTGGPLNIDPTTYNPVDGQPKGLVAAYIDKLKETFTQDLSQIGDCAPLSKIPFNPDRNWLIASEAILPKAWQSKLDIKFIFNDPVLYGAYLNVKGLFEIDILYRKISERVGLWSLEFALDPALRTVEMGSASITFPNIGLDIFTNGDWKVDIGFPRGTDYSRSCLVQILPFVGWGGFYLMKARTASITLFGQYITDEYAEENDILILQAGLALRVGLGKYLSKGPLYIGASISVYGVLEGAFAFEGKQTGLSTFLPDHFALFGRVGIIAEVLGYVDFKIIKAAVHILLVVETGVKLVYLSKSIGAHNKGLQPVLLYIEGRVSVAVRVKIACFKIWRKKICIYINFHFTTLIRFEFTLGPGSNRSNRLAKSLLLPEAYQVIDVEIGDLPVCYLPGVARQGAETFWVHNFALPFFYYTKDEKGFKAAEDNIIVEKILRPLLESLAANGIVNYEDIRNVLLDGEGPQGRVELHFPKYRPVFYTGFGYDETELLAGVFGFKSEEMTEFRNYLAKPESSCDVPSTDGGCLYRMVPIPIVAPVAMCEKGKSPQPFDKLAITIEGIFEGNENPKVLEDIPYTPEYLKQVEEALGSFRTQFSDRAKTQAKTLEVRVDLRREQIASDFFKLFALLAMEGYVSSLAREDREAVITGATPIVISDLLKEATKGMETLLGQVNLYYTSGLRLPKRNTPGSFESYFQVTEQASAVKLKALPDWEEVIIRLNGTPIHPDMFGDKLSFEEWYKDLREKTLANPADLASQFGPLRATSPYSLRRYSVSLSASRYEISGTEGRWYEIPEVLRSRMRQKDLEAISFRLFLGEKDADYSAEAEARGDGFVPPVELDVKPISQCNLAVRQIDPHTFEIGQASVEDLLRAEGLRQAVTGGAADIYFRSEADSSEGSKTVLSPAGSVCWLVRTNLSAKTHPPIILSRKKRAVDVPPYEYIASSNDAPRFAHLLWEALAANHGGFFLVFTQPVTGHTDKEGSARLTISFALNPLAPTALANFLHVVQPESVHKKITSGDQYLFIDWVKLRPSDKDYVQEYHSKIPAHCMGFEQQRTLPDEHTKAFEDYESKYSQYLPMEYALEDAKGATIISCENALPVMPLAGTNENIKLYRHITPLVKSIPGQLDRYNAVGSNFTVRTGIRDIFGFRAEELSAELKNYKHHYFDKLVPLESWPLLKFSYWLKEKNGNVFTWVLTGKLDLDSLYAHTGLKTSTHAKDLTVPKRAAAIAAADSLLDQLRTIEAQINDKKVTITFQGGEGKDLDKFLRDRVTAARKELDKLFNFIEEPKEAYLPEDQEDTWTFTTKLATNTLKIPLQFTISIARNQEFCIGGKPQPGDDCNEHSILHSPGVWGYESVEALATPIKLENPRAFSEGMPADHSKSALHLLNAQISKEKDYVLGLSMASGGDQVLYILSQTLLRIQPAQIRKPRAGEAVPPGAKFLFEDGCYYGIKPYSNKLWSGVYRPQDGSEAEQQFTQVDLDQAMRTVLEKIDKLLDGVQLFGPVTEETKWEDEAKWSDRLIIGKQNIVDRELAQLLDYVLQPGTVQPNTKAEFRNLLLERLTHFYQYDGLIRTAVKPRPELEGHRLTLSVDAVANYTIVSSKIHFKGASESPEWSLLFNQVDPQSVSFPVQATVTHVEFAIDRVEGSEIETSRWIQLVQPVVLERVDVSSWPLIVRKFPPKPAIINQVARQVLGKEGLPSEWDIKKVGLWNAVLELHDDRAFVDSDRLLFDLDITFAKQADLESERVQGFIAYWASVIKLTQEKKAAFPRQAFIKDLDAVLNGLLQDKAVKVDADPAWTFRLKKKVKDEQHQWEVEEEGTMLKGKVKAFTQVNGIDKKNQEFRIIVEVGPFNLFENARAITSVRAKVRALRNTEVLKYAGGNHSFVYETETVQAATPAVPQIRYVQPLRMDAPGKTFGSEVYKHIPQQMAYKSTAKYLLITDDGISGLPERPVQHLESSPGMQALDMDKVFEGFNLVDGLASVSLTLLHPNETVPLFHAENIIRIN